MCLGSGDDDGRSSQGGSDLRDDDRLQGHHHTAALSVYERRLDHLQHWPLRLRDPGVLAGEECQGEGQHQTPGP